MLRLNEPNFTGVKDVMNFITKITTYLNELIRTLRLNIQNLEDAVSLLILNLFRSVVIVKSVDDLQNIDSSKLYLIDGEVDMGATSIVVPEGGISLSSLNGARDVAKLISSADNYTLFKTASGSYSGNVGLESYSIEITGTNSKVFDLDNDGNGSALDIVGVNFNNCTSLGSLSNYRQLFFTNCGFLFCEDGLTFNGTWSGGATIVDTIAIGWPAATLFKKGTSLIFQGAVRSNMNFLSANTSATLFDFEPANVQNKGSFSLNNVRTRVTNPVPNFPSSDSKAKFKNNEGFKNTYIGGQYYISSAVATDLASVPTNTLVKLAGTTTYSDEQWFDHITSNALRYIGDQNIEVEVKGNISLTGTNGDVVVVYVRKWDNLTSTMTTISQTGGSTMNASGRAECISFNGMTSLKNGDRIEIWVSNTSANRNVTAQLNGYVIVSERA